MIITDLRKNGQAIKIIYIAPTVSHELTISFKRLQQTHEKGRKKRPNPIQFLQSLDERTKSFL